MPDEDDSVQDVIDEQSDKIKQEKIGDLTASHGLEGEKKVVEHFKPKRALTPEQQRKALEDYTNWENCAKMNGYLRGQIKDPDKETVEKTKMLQELINQHKLPHDVATMRGVTNTGFLPEEDMTGKTITNSGFVSTSFGPNVPDEYVKQQKDGKPVIFDIHVPKGYNAVPASAFTDKNPDDHELILNHGSKFYVNKESMKDIGGKPTRCLHVTAM